MGEQNSYNDYSTESDKCPNCGAMKVFSALVCPACGMSYAEAAEIKKNTPVKKIQFYKGDTEEEEKKPVSMTDFDPNAALKEFKSSLQRLRKLLKAQSRGLKELMRFLLTADYIIKKENINLRMNLKKLLPLCQKNVPTPSRTRP